MTRHHLLFCGLMVALMVIPFLPLEYSFASGERWPNHSGDIHPTPAITTAGGTIAGPVCIQTDTNGGVCCYSDTMDPVCGIRIDDSSGRDMVANAEDVAPFSAVTRLPANYIMRAGMDSHTVNVLSGLGGCTAADYVKLDYAAVSGISSKTCTYTVDWCSGVGADTCANATEAAVRLAVCLNLVTAQSATTSGATCPGGAANARCVGLTPASKTYALWLTQNDATCTVVSNGSVGVIVVPFTNDTGTPIIGWKGPGATGYSGLGGYSGTYPNEVALFSNGSMILEGTVSTFSIFSTGAFVPSAGFLGHNSRSRLYSSADGKFGFKKADATTGAGLDFTTASRLSLTKADGTTLGEYAETMVASATITLNNAAAQTIYTVPAGFTFLPSEVYVRNASTGTDATVAGGWGCDANCTNYRSGAVFGSAITATTSIARVSVQRDTEYKTCAAASVFCYKLTVASVDADTVTMEVYGVLR